MRIIAGRHRGRRLLAPSGAVTRPTADRVRQALFDMLWHAPWGGRETVQDRRVLDAFAGTGALGLEALSRGAAHATFLENDRAALAALRTNIGGCREVARTTVLAVDATRPPRPPGGQSCALVFLDPPYAAEGALIRSLAALVAGGWLAPGALVCAESTDEVGEQAPEPPPGLTLLDERSHGLARVQVFRAP